MNDWQPEIEELRRRQAPAQDMGGADRVARQRERGKLTVRERIAGLLDPGSLREWGSLAGEARYDETGHLVAFRASSCLGGRGTIDARPVVVGADDFTVKIWKGDELLVTGDLATNPEAATYLASATRSHSQPKTNLLPLLTSPMTPTAAAASSFPIWLPTA